MNRKQRRERDKIIKKSKVKQTDFDQKLGLFDLMPEECLLCHKGFDRTDKSMVQTWNVVVREKEQIVRVYCPECWAKAISLLNEFGIKPDENQNR